MNRDAYVQIIKSAFITLGRNFTMGWITSQAPWIMVPGIKQVIEHYVNKFWEAAAEQGDLAVFILYIDLRVGGQKTDFESAANDNYWVQMNGTKEEKEVAEANLIAAHRRFIFLKS